MGGQEKARACGEQGKVRQNQPFPQAVHRQQLAATAPVRAEGAHHNNRLTGYREDKSHDQQTSDFYKDEALSFSRVLLMGREWDLLLFNIITYAIWDLATGDTFVAIIITYVFELAIRWTRQA